MKFIPVFKCEACGTIQALDETEFGKNPQTPDGWVCIMGGVCVCGACAKDWVSALDVAFADFMRLKKQIAERGEELRKAQLNSLQQERNRA